MELLWSETGRRPRLKLCDYVRNGEDRDGCDFRPVQVEGPNAH